ncbi:hypothetical protein [Stenoxybacter acetivorans]|uniref:hypothetical protein n=1 Tax=Stenoxybacter acetivorans TaxID=422441 RepID=UPI00056AEC9F|nr:hypothetical protein [Stenoxybacter acetivorans]
MNTQILGLYFLPLGILSMCAAALWQIHVMFSETYSLDRFKDKQLVWVVTALFFSFSLAVYWFAPNARKKGLVFLLLGGGGLLMYVLGRLWLPWQQ